LAISPKHANVSDKIGFALQLVISSDIETQNIFLTQTLSARAMQAFIEGGPENLKNLLIAEGGLVGTPGKSDFEQERFADFAKTGILQSPSQFAANRFRADPFQHDPIPQKVLGRLIINGAQLFGTNLANRERLRVARGPPSLAAEKRLALRVQAIQALPNEIKRKIRSGEIDPNTNRGLIALTEHIDIGNFANSVRFEDALRIAKLESSLAIINTGLFGKFDTSRMNAGNTVRNQSILNSLIANGGLTLQGRGLMLGGADFSTISNFIGSGLVSATDAFQVQSVATPPHILADIARRRAFRHSKEGVIAKKFHNMVWMSFVKVRGGKMGAPITSAFGTTQGQIIKDNPGLLSVLDFLQAGLALGDITRAQAQVIGYNVQQLKAQIKIGKAVRLEKLRQIEIGKNDIKRWEERREAMSSGTGGI